MNLKRKKQFINQLINNVKKDIIDKADKFPKHWDGIELRQFISDTFSNVVIAGTMSKKRKADYYNTKIVDGL